MFHHTSGLCVDCWLSSQCHRATGGMQGAAGTGILLSRSQLSLHIPSTSSSTELLLGMKQPGLNTRQDLGFVMPSVRRLLPFCPALPAGSRWGLNTGGGMPEISAKGTWESSSGCTRTENGAFYFETLNKLSCFRDEQLTGRSQTPGTPTFLVGASEGENSVKTFIWVNIGCRTTPLNPRTRAEGALGFINSRREGSPEQSHCRAVSPSLREAELHSKARLYLPIDRRKSFVGLSNPP